jgi:hypothetical protein
MSIKIQGIQRRGKISVEFHKGKGKVIKSQLGSQTSDAHLKFLHSGG